MSVPECGADLNQHRPMAGLFRNNSLANPRGASPDPPQSRSDKSKGRLTDKSADIRAGTVDVCLRGQGGHGAEARQCLQMTQADLTRLLCPIRSIRLTHVRAVMTMPRSLQVRVHACACPRRF